MIEKRRRIDQRAQENKMEVQNVEGGRDVPERTLKSGSGKAWKRVTWRRNRFFSPVPIINKRGMKPTRGTKRTRCRCKMTENEGGGLAFCLASD